MEIYHSDNMGNRVPPHANLADPELASGQTLTNATAATDTEATVVAGESYVITALTTGGFYFGLAAISTAANILWVCPLGQTIVIKIPVGYTTLHYATNVNNGVAYMRKLAR